MYRRRRAQCESHPAKSNAREQSHPLGELSQDADFQASFVSRLREQVMDRAGQSEVADADSVAISSTSSLTRAHDLAATAAHIRKENCAGDPLVSAKRATVNCCCDLAG